MSKTLSTIELQKLRWNMEQSSLNRLWRQFKVQSPEMLSARDRQRVQTEVRDRNRCLANKLRVTEERGGITRDEYMRQFREAVKFCGDPKNRDSRHFY